MARPPSPFEQPAEAVFTPSSTTQAYQYRPLDQQKREIRLFRFADILAASSNLTASVTQTSSQHTLQGALQVFAMDNAPTFKALSYEWGGKSSEKILVQIEEHGSISIRPILRDFLNTLKHFSFDHSTWFWIDQICIDRSSTTERHHQVQLMSEIYSEADEVLAWIGDALPNSRCQRLGEDIWLRLVHCNYWKRLWMMQEVLLANKLTICGFENIVDWGQVWSWSWPQKDVVMSANNYRVYGTCCVAKYPGPRPLRCLYYQQSTSFAPAGV